MKSNNTKSIKTGGVNIFELADMLLCCKFHREDDGWRPADRTCCENCPNQKHE